MSFSPQEILDVIVDHLRDEPTALKACCVVSKYWIHRTRKHLFARVKFHTPKPHPEPRKKTPPDPSNSPAHHTRTLSIHGLSVITAADANAGGWIRTFQCRRFAIGVLWLGGPQSLPCPVPRIIARPQIPTSHLCLPRDLDLICSFPLLDDLELVPLDSGSAAWNAPSTSPKLTGYLELRELGMIGPAAHRLLDLPGGLYFAKITVACHNEDVESIMDLVSGCSDTLKFLDISYRSPACVFPFNLRGQ